MILASIILVGLLGGDGEQPPPPKKIHIQCKSDVMLRGKEILLRDLASVKTPDPRLTENLRNISFGVRPAHNYNRIITRDDVLARLLKAKLRLADMLVDGATEIAVQPLTTRLTRAQIQETANTALDSLLQLETNPDIEYQLRSQLQNTAVPPGRRSLELQSELHGNLRQSSACINILVMVDEELFRTIPVHYALKRFSMVLETNKPVRKDQALDASNVTIKRVATPHGTSMWLTDMNDLSGKVSVSKLPAGQRLMPAHLTEPSVVHVGEIVDLVSGSNRVRIALKVRAMESGSIGRTIKVQVLSSKNPRVLFAQVQSAGLVRMQPAGIR